MNYAQSTDCSKGGGGDYAQSTDSNTGGKLCSVLRL